MHQQIKVKSERITALKRALGTMNRDSDKRCIVDLDQLDLDEYDDLLDDDETPQCIADVPTPQTSSNEEVDDDCFAINTDQQATQPNIMTIGVEEMLLEIDRDFSLEYSYTTDVRYNDI